MCILAKRGERTIHSLVGWFKSPLAVGMGSCNLLQNPKHDFEMMLKYDIDMPIPPSFLPQVHERTHRNDRPFECNICHQKFYRKEPMQKHQWRQHGVVHFKARPHPAGINTTGPPTAPLVLPESPSADSPLGPPGSTVSAANVLYNSIVDRIKFNSLETMGESSRHLDGSPEVMLPPPPPPRQQPPPTRPPSSPQSGPEDLSNHHRAEPADESEEPDDVGPAPEIGNHEMPPSGESTLHVPPPIRDLSSPLPTPLNAKLLTTLPAPPPPPPALPTEPTSTSAVVEDDDDEHRPIKLKKLLAHAYQKEVEEAENQSHLQQRPPSPLPVAAPPSLSQDDFASSSEESSSSTYNCNNTNNSNNHSQSSPAAQQEMVECQCKACGHVFSVLDPYNFRCGNCNVKYTSLPTHMIADPLQCIGCCQVFPHKPALKSHQMGISDGGSGVASALGGERPFRCCKCGYGFRQKAHLQKHQWRIHRRKLEPDPSVKEAEALMHAIKGIPPPPPVPQQQQQPSKPSPPTLLNDGKIATITIQEIIDRGVERSMGRPFFAPSSSSSASDSPASPAATASAPGGGMQPLDLSPVKSITTPMIGNRDDPKLTDLVAAMPPLGPSATGRPPPLMSSLPMLPPTPREPNPLFSQLPLQLPTEPVRIAAIEQPDSSPSSSNKRQRTLDATPPSASLLSSVATIHRSLPPITSLQRPPTLTATMTPNWAHSADTKDSTRINASDLAKKDLFIRGQLQHGLRTQQHEQSDVRTV